MRIEIPCRHWWLLQVRSCRNWRAVEWGRAWQVPNCRHLHLVRGHSTLLVIATIGHRITPIGRCHVGRMLTVHAWVIGVLHGSSSMLAIVIGRGVMSIVRLCVVVPRQELGVHVGPRVHEERAHVVWVTLKAVEIHARGLTFSAPFKKYFFVVRRKSDKKLNNSPTESRSANFASQNRRINCAFISPKLSYSVSNLGCHFISETTNLISVKYSPSSSWSWEQNLKFLSKDSTFMSN